MAEFSLEALRLTLRIIAKIRRSFLFRGHDGTSVKTSSVSRHHNEQSMTKRFPGLQATISSNDGSKFLFPLPRSERLHVTFRLLISNTTSHRNEIEITYDIGEPSKLRSTYREIPGLFLKKVQQAAAAQQLSTFAPGTPVLV